MKKLYFLLVTVCLYSSVNAQIANIPDANFRYKLITSDSYYQNVKDLSGAYFKIDANNNNVIEISEANNVSYLNVSGFNISSLDGIQYFPNLTTLICSDNNISTLNVSSLVNLTELICSNNKMSSLIINNSNQITKLDYSKNQFSNLNFTNLTSLVDLNCDSNQITSLNVSNLTNLKNLRIDYNKIASIDLSNLIDLETFSCMNNLITSLDLSNNSNLKSLSCSENKISTLDLSNNSNLKDLTCSDNQISALDLNNLTQLTDLVFEGTLISKINLENNINLKNLYCSNNLLTELNLSNLKQLNDLHCSNNQLTALDVSALSKLTLLICQYNKLISLNLKNGITDNFDAQWNPDLKFLCIDDIDYTVFYYDKGYLSDCVINSYCSFTPGGTFYTIQGNCKLDADNNSCDIDDNGFPNLNFSITNGTNPCNIIANTTGNFLIPVGQGSYTITPVLENPAYFNISPTSINVNFPEQTSPFIHDFCIAPNGIYQDLEITLLPLSVARPGFDANYKMIYRNIGTKTLSGSVNLKLNDDTLLDLVSVNPATSSQTVNNLNWDFTDLKPFETREIEFTININSPMETPAVNEGDILSFVATVFPIEGDLSPENNGSALRQIVVNSKDPNDKTCLEGQLITPALIGQYVHYMIRFENTGNYPAQNIVVKDMIDLSKFDISTLVPISASHSYVTRITNGSEVEFIFENINLPFDEVNNDGYIAFKIKTLPTLLFGDSFENEANIYFDYNFPILTNKAITTFERLGIQDFEFSNYFSLYPNPVNDVLKLSTKTSIEVNSISIYNTLGQMVIAIPNAGTVSAIDVANLTSGAYFVKVNTNKGTSNMKFIKN